ncbi:hypothetical protein NQ317_010759 [Molorchus minor]|uniref:Uncharacterized protein n=1 Tax=Molorchus minor TaxID=1323400 RepID=A0ABQ9IQN4_9CUCU|nr:hypothetical protein NQ317_010759 [Molorchus minor]
MYSIEKSGYIITVNCCEESAHSDLNPTQIAQVVHDTNEGCFIRGYFLDNYSNEPKIILSWADILTVLKLVIQYRLQNTGKFYSSQRMVQKGVVDVLILQIWPVALTDPHIGWEKMSLRKYKGYNKGKGFCAKQYCSDRHKRTKPLCKFFH